MIIEGVLTCDSPSGPHVAALGPVVDEARTAWLLRPFQSSRVFSCLRANPKCVFHTIDDALPIVQLVLGQSPAFTYERSPAGGWLICQACHWFELEITAWDVTQPRSEAQARVLAEGDLRPFWGWNRAKHALLEAAIAISRVHLLSAEELALSLERCRAPIEKTCGPREQLAWDLIQSWHAQHTLQAHLNSHSH